jgi:hypothetical protein
LAGSSCIHCGKEHDSRTKFCPQTGKVMPPQRPTPDDGGGRATRLMYLPPEVRARMPGSSRSRPTTPRSVISSEDGPAVAGYTESPPPTPAEPVPALPEAAAAPFPEEVPVPVEPELSVSFKTPISFTSMAVLKPGGNGAHGPLARPTPGAIAGTPALDQAVDEALASAATSMAPALSAPAWADTPEPDVLSAAALTGAIAQQPSLPAAAKAETNPDAGTTTEEPVLSADDAVADNESPPENVPSPIADPLDAPIAAQPAEAFAVEPPAITSFASPPGATVEAPSPPKDSGERRAKKKSKSSVPSWIVRTEDNDTRRPSARFAAFDDDPLDFMRLLHKTGRFYAANFVKVLIVAVVLLGPVSLLTSGAVAVVARDSLAEVVIGFLVSLLMMGLAWPLTTGTLSLSVLHRLQGGIIDPQRDWRAVVRRLFPLATAAIPTSLIIAVGYFPLFVPGLVASLLLALVPTVVLLEGKAGLAAIKRSANLMKDVLGRAIGIQVAFVAVTLLVRKLVTGLVPGRSFASLLLCDLTMILLSPLPMIALTLLYLDARKEGEAFTPEGLRDELDALDS